MEQTTATAIYYWVETHPQHAQDYNFDLENDDTAYVVNKVVSKPEKLIDYENPEGFCMNGQAVANGCGYVFKRGPCYRIQYANCAKQKSLCLPRSSNLQSGNHHSSDNSSNSGNSPGFCSKQEAFEDGTGNSNL